MAAVAVALLVGSGLGFGLGSSVTPSGSAGTNIVGLGFLPVRGWTVIQSGTTIPTGAATAIAANVPIHPDDDLRHTPHATLESLPHNGVLIFATFTTRGDPGEDLKFAVRSLPLQMRGAEPTSTESDPLPAQRSLAQYRLRGGVRGYNVDVRIYFGTSPPTGRMLAAAQRQLNRLVVASERVTIFARSSVSRWGYGVEVFGSVDNGKGGESVTLQSKDCGKQFFRTVGGVITSNGGGWSTRFSPGINATVRAVWNDVASAQINVRQRAWVLVKKRWATSFEVSVWGRASFERKHVLIQRLDRRLGTWSTVKSVVLTERFLWNTSATFRASFPKGTTIRAVFPRSQARPCFLSGVSNPLRI